MADGADFQRSERLKQFLLRFGVVVGHPSEVAFADSLNEIRGVPVGVAHIRYRFRGPCSAVAQA